MRSFDEVHQQMEDQSRVQWRNHVERNELKVFFDFSIPSQRRCKFFAHTGRTLQNFETYPRRVIFSGMMNELEVSPNFHRSDEINLRSAANIPDHAGRFRPRYWIFVRPSSEKSGIRTSGPSWKIQKGTGISKHYTFTPNLAAHPSRVRRSSCRVLLSLKELNKKFTSIPANTVSARCAS